MRALTQSQSHRPRDMRAWARSSGSRAWACSRLFSASVFREMAKHGHSPLFARLVRECGLLDKRPSSELVRDTFEAAFDVLKQGGVRSEYIYKAALTQRILLGRHSLSTASMLTEFRAGACKADVAILNGTSTVYEIKSERDSLSRLQNQVECYRHVFANVVVIAGENHVGTVLGATPPDVGVMSLSPRHQITTIREAENRPDRISVNCLFESIRTFEAKEILRCLGVPVPSGPNTEMRNTMRESFALLRPEEAHEGFVRTLRWTRSMKPLAPLLSRLPQSLHAAALSVPVRKGDHERLLGAVDTRLERALEWA